MEIGQGKGGREEGRKEGKNEGREEGRKNEVEMKRKSLTWLYVPDEENLMPSFVTAMLHVSPRTPKSETEKWMQNWWID